MNVVEANGARMPAIGLGTMTLKEQVCIDAIKTALRLGYRHLDTAERYGNEQWVGEGLHQGLAASGRWSAPLRGRGRGWSPSCTLSSPGVIQRLLAQGLPKRPGPPPASRSERMHSKRRALSHV